MNKSKLGRHLGVGPNFHGEFPPSHLSVPIERLAGAELRGPGLSGVGCGDQVLALTIDPPVGGFAIGDLLAQFPRASAVSTVTAVESASTSRAFAPGHWSLRMAVSSPLVNNIGLQMAISQLNAAGDAFEAPGGGAYASPRWVFHRYHATNHVPWVAEASFYLSHPWALFLTSETTLADSNVMTFEFAAHAIHLLDYHPATE